jgi:hypothetical protein
VNQESSAHSPAIQGWAAIPNWIVRDDSISGNAKLVYICLSSRTDRAGETWPSHALIAKEARLSASTVKVALNELRSLGLVSWKQQQNPAGGLTSNRYFIHATPSQPPATP